MLDWVAKANRQRAMQAKTLLEVVKDPEESARYNTRDDAASGGRRWSTRHHQEELLDDAASRRR